MPLISMGFESGCQKASIHCGPSILYTKHVQTVMNYKNWFKKDFVFFFFRVVLPTFVTLLLSWKKKIYIYILKIKAECRKGFAYYSYLVCQVNFLPMLRFLWILYNFLLYFERTSSSHGTTVSGYHLCHWANSPRGWCNKCSPSAAVDLVQWCGWWRVKAFPCSTCFLMSFQRFFIELFSFHPFHLFVVDAHMTSWKYKHILLFAEPIISLVFSLMIKVK